MLPRRSWLDLVCFMLLLCFLSMSLVLHGVSARRALLARPAPLLTRPVPHRALALGALAVPYRYLQCRLRPLAASPRIHDAW